MLKGKDVNADVVESTMEWVSRSEEEFKVLINVAPKSLREAEEICKSIDRALRENPEWEKFFPKHRLSRELR